MRFELDLFEGLSPFLNSNPRKIKRITNIYHVVRRVVVLNKRKIATDDPLICKILPWIILCEQWPVRMSWFVQVILDDWQQSDSHDQWKETNLWDFYNLRVKPRYNDIGLAHVPESLKMRYQRLFALDSDKDIFEKMMEEKIANKDGAYYITVGDIGVLAKREKNKLISYSINLNPALIEVLNEIASIHPRGEGHQSIPDSNQPGTREKRRLRSLSVEEVARMLSTAIYFPYFIRPGVQNGSME